MPKKNIILDRKRGLYLKKAGAKGRGVFCSGGIKAGEVLEVTPTIVLNEASTRHTDKTILANYVFETGELPKRVRNRLHIKKAGHSCTVIMGIASFCNHAEKPNAEVLWEEQAGSLYYTLKAIRPIPRHTEICTAYGDGWFDDKNMAVLPPTRRK